MKKKLIGAVAFTALAGLLTFGFNSELEAKKAPYDCRNGTTKGNKTLGICYGSGGDCHRCLIF